ncbi:DUF998 domain-containing protein [Micromonospora zhanjiangensis]|uniref:DUF998 domain-containing protein n=1 Tax=Micromonospora zhanjiangensis TaxID=1522057 RepID=A0ABV8KH72_9ACTN
MAEPRRAAAAGAAVCATAGAAAVVLAVVAGPSPGLSGYVSEAGVTASRYATTYRLGVFGLAAGLALLAVALPAALRYAVGLLGASAAGTVLSGVVTCSDGCPLPPFERAGVADLVHGGASVAAVAGCVFAMLVVTWSAPPGAIRRWSGTALAVALPLSGAVGLAMLAVGRGTVTGLLERLLLADVLAWATILAMIISAGHRPPAPAGGVPATAHRGSGPSDGPAFPPDW